MDTISILKISKGNNSAKNVGGVQLLISARRLVMLYISTKFCEIISSGIKVIERTRFLYGKLQREFICAKYYEIISNGIKVIERTRFLY